MPRHHYAIVACAKWENPYLAEWLLYHQSIGFDHVYLYSNDDDPTDCYETVRPFLSSTDPFVTFTHYPYAGTQGQMYKHFLGRYAEEVEWFIFLDIDEFTVFRKDGTVGAFLESFQDRADKIFLNWLVFGHSGYKERPPGSVLLQYTQRDRFVNEYTKILTRRSSVDIDRVINYGETGFWHSWNFRDEPLSRVVNAIGDDMSGYYGDFPKSAQAYLSQGDRQERLIETAVVYHYQFRSELEIERRIQRGLGGDFEGQSAFKAVLASGQKAAFLERFSAVTDTSLRDYWRYFRDQAKATSITTRPTAPNIALHKPALQSSISPWSRGKTVEADAAGVVSGVFASAYNCHTELEDKPWWYVDLQDIHRIRHIQIFNRIDAPIFKERVADFSIDLSFDAIEWVTLYRTAEPLIFGGTDGHPFIWNSETGAEARYVRFQLHQTTLLHLNAVEIYEQPWAPIPIEARDYGALAERIASAALMPARHEQPAPPESSASMPETLRQQADTDAVVEDRQDHDDHSADHPLPDPEKIGQPSEPAAQSRFKDEPAAQIHGAGRQGGWLANLFSSRRSKH